MKRTGRRQVDGKLKKELTKIPKKEKDRQQWFLSFIEARYTRLAHKSQIPTDKILEKKETKVVGKATDFKSLLQPGKGEEVLAKLPSSYWSDIMHQYRKRQIYARKNLRRSVKDGVGSSPGVLGTTNWVPIGPSVVRRGQTLGRPAIGGRTNRIAIAPGGTPIYVASGDGGVWRSDDQGATWSFRMDNFDIDPTAFATTSISCGAIAIDENDPNRVYVGTGEGDTWDIFNFRFLNALPCYLGVGPIRSDDGGITWINEPTASTSTSLVGNAFFALAVDPNDRENVVAATNVGIYRRESDGSGGYQWVQKITGVHTDVVVAQSGGVTTFYAAPDGISVLSSNDGSTWTQIGGSLPVGGFVRLAVQQNNPNVVYSLVYDLSSDSTSAYRLDGPTRTWTQISGIPSDLTCGQGVYDLSIAVDPNNVNTIFIGGGGRLEGTSSMLEDASIYLCRISSSGSGSSTTYSTTPVLVGPGVHGDVHALAYTPGDSNTLWVCCDGGVFKTTNASTIDSSVSPTSYWDCSGMTLQTINSTTAPQFQSCNVGLGTMSAMKFSQHPTQTALVFCGFQDNGTARYVGEECWDLVGPGDGGYCVVNWNNPYKVIIYADGNIWSAVDGGQGFTDSSWGSWSLIEPGYGWEVWMASPLATTPYNPSNPSEADIIAYAAYAQITPPPHATYQPAVFISENFGISWTQAPTVTSGLIYSMRFASAIRLYIGTTTGEVYRYDKSGSSWTQTRIDDVVSGALPLNGIITSVAIDPADTTGQSIYITFGGSGDYRHVWHFNGTSWQAKSGPSAGAITSLLDVEHNAIVVDPDNTSNLYVGADIGVWQSTDGGSNWYALENGLPDAAVLDLQIHEPSRRLRAALHGRGMFEYKLDLPAATDVELYIRDTMLDLGFVNTVDGLDDPSQPPTSTVVHWESPNIKVDVPTPAGYQTPSSQINFYQFIDKIVDGSQGVATIDSSLGTVTNRVYIEVHNRGIKVEPTVQVMILLANASPHLPQLPIGYTTNVQTGTPISTSVWQTVGFGTINNLKVGVPQVIEFPLPSTMLPPPASLPGQSHYCLLAIVQSSNDPFTNTQTNVDTLTVTDRKVAQKNLHIVQFVGTPPAGGRPWDRWLMIQLNGIDEKDVFYDLLIDRLDFRGQLSILVPKEILGKKTLHQQKLGGRNLVRDWSVKHTSDLQTLMKAGRYNYQECAKMIQHTSNVKDQSLIVFGGENKIHELNGLRFNKGASHMAFLNVRLPPKVTVGDKYEFRIIQRDSQSRETIGGCTYIVEIVPRYKQKQVKKDGLKRLLRVKKIKKKTRKQ